MRRAACLLALVLLAGSCNPSEAPTAASLPVGEPVDEPVAEAEAPEPAPSEVPEPADGFALHDPFGDVDGTFAPSEPPAFAVEPVETLLPEIRLDAPDGAPLDSDVVRAALDLPGVSFATAVTIGRVPVRLADGRAGELTIAGVDPAGYRVLVPQITADEPGVWQRMVEGHLTVTHEIAEELGIALDDELDHPSGPLRVSVLAALGQPPMAAGVVDLLEGQRFGLGPPSTLLVAVEADAWPDEVAAELERALGLEATLVYGKPQRRLEGLPSSTVWDQLAMCEASGNWGADTGNGYYGGLQFLPSSWHLVGGTGLPHEASRDEQIYRAELILQRQGWRAWPVCSVRLGLRQPEAHEHPDGRPRRPPPSPIEESSGQPDDAES